MQDDVLLAEASVLDGDYETVFECLERDARRYSRAFSEEEEAKRV